MIRYFIQGVWHNSGLSMDVVRRDKIVLKDFAASLISGWLESRVKVFGHTEKTLPKSVDILLEEDSNPIARYSFELKVTPHYALSGSTKFVL
jgi:hypothetical protein